MSGRVTNSLSREKIQRLLMAVGSEPTEDITQVEATEYNWHEPHYFSSEQLAKLGYFTEAVAVAMAQKFSKFCHSEFNVTVASTTQCYVHEFLSMLSDSEQRDYHLPFGADQKHLCGLIGIPEQTAVNWATQLLGDSETKKDSSRNLSQLEESLLLYLASALVDVFSGPDKSFDFHPAKSIVRGQWPLELEGTEEIFKISFDVKEANSEKSSEAYFLILCSELTPVTGKTARDSGEFSAEDNSKLILGHLQEMPVTVTAHLASTMLTFEEIMNLQADDIVLLNKRVDQPVELIVDGRAICCGWPAKSAGKYAVTIAPAALGDTTLNVNLNTGTQ
ncbi:MAG TPA: FliM/FliN family flagellar motor switch protein [Sedimentisphaerales bacterium]|nr:FliM/FliN family flagellar motor switch protein [Sedimentisphaerales bacterium]